MISIDLEFFCERVLVTQLFIKLNT